MKLTNCLDYQKTVLGIINLSIKQTNIKGLIKTFSLFVCLFVQNTTKREIPAFFLQMSFLWNN